MNKKGFTLVELLTVIILLSLIALVTTPVIIGVLNSSKENLRDQQIQIVEKAAERWGVDNLKKLPTTDNPYCYINISELGKYISNSASIKDPKTGQTMNGRVLITKKGNQYEYKYNPAQPGNHC